MALLAGDVIDAARDRHVAFDRERCPNGLCLRLLSGYAVELHGKITRLDEDVLRTEFSTPLPLANFAAGIALPANRTIVAVAGQPVGSTDQFDILLVPASNKSDVNTPLAAAYQIGDVLYLRGNAQLWNAVASVAIATVPVPSPFLKSSDAVWLPDTSKRALAENLALALAKRGHNDPTLPAIDLAAFAASAADAEKAYLDDVQNRLTGRAFYTRDVMTPLRGY